MKILITGAYGFIGAHIVSALLRAGHEPVAAVRATRVDTALPGVASIACDFARDTDPAVWRPRLAGIDAVVNCTGILRESGAATFEKVHETVPAALFDACAEMGVKRIVQVSALGDPADGEFIASKHRGDARLLASGVAAVVLRPSVVYSTRGSYGGTTLLRGLAALPWVPLPGKGDQRLQPLDADDLAHAVLAALERDEAVGQILPLGGPQALTLREYLALWRRWLGLGETRFITTPKPLARIGAWLGEKLGRGPLGMTMWRMLERGNVLNINDAERAAAALDWTPARMDAVLAQAPASSADRWQARSVFLQPLLRVVLALTFIASGIVGFALPAEQVAALFAHSPFPAAWAPVLGLTGSVADIVLGAWLLSGRAPRAALAAMALLVLGYSGFIGLLLPQAWLDPFGGLLKNGLVLVAIAFAAAGAERQ
ncbi:NAD(P)H-binding protein [Denitratimonas sp. CY0512]|uniref:NAD(P)H-binding protein n=1 Tax=Denitratimonas sp. CY0512 TaxID=3131940 RepID=UPI0030A4E03E